MKVAIVTQYEHGIRGARMKVTLGDVGAFFAYRHELSVTDNHIQAAIRLADLELIEPDFGSMVSADLPTQKLTMVHVLDCEKIAR